MAVLIAAVFGQILTVVANVLVVSLLSCLAMVLSPFNTRAAFYSHIANQPLADQIQMAFSGFSKKRYMLGQKPGSKPIGQAALVVVLAVLGLSFTFLSTIVFQTSHTQLRNTKTTNAQLVSVADIPTSTYSGTTNNLLFPVISDDYIASVPLKDKSITRTILPSDYWNDNVGLETQSKLQFSGEVYLSLSDANWMSIQGGDQLSTMVSMTIDGITAESLPTAALGVVSVQVIQDSLPDVFAVPVITETTGLTRDNINTFTVDGVHSMDVVQHSLLRFDSQTWDTKDNLDRYYAYLDSQKSFVNQNGTLLFNNTYDYQTKNPYDKKDLETDLQVGGKDPLRYSLISVRNTTASTDKFQTYTITKRSVFREDNVSTQYGTIHLVEYHYWLQVTKFGKARKLNDNFKIKYSRGTDAPTSYRRLPMTPVYMTNKQDYITAASVTQDKNIYVSYIPETYVDMVPLIALICVYAGILFLMGAFSFYWNMRHFVQKVYSIPHELVSYLFYSPDTNLGHIIDKVNSLELSMVDGYDPQLGYNHLGLISLDDAQRISKAEPDVPFGQTFRKKKNFGFNFSKKEETEV
ncbi:hypothetical protein, no similarity [Geotrichum candidum]|uniref:Uncharacterized protein n=1 Tax=Geotrichum candidum TaxID=1173061 RepID=A0A0J9XFY5_GEOCN|nr:hypothetical protein, no similarity [Geotrichum candidum]